MDKKQLKEALEILKKPITANCVEYKYFTQENYDKLIKVYDNAQCLADYSLKQDMLLNDLQQKIAKAIEYIENKEAIINTDKIRIFDLFKIEEQGYIDKLLEILKGDSND